MKTKSQLMSVRNRQLPVFFVLSAGMAGLTGLLQFSNNTTGFSRFLGSIDPFLAIAIIILLGTWVFHTSLKRKWVAVYQPLGHKSLLLIIGVPIVFAIPTLVVDSAFPFPEDTNILFPESLVFYPVIGFAVEILFHVIPVCLLFLIFTAKDRTGRSGDFIWLYIYIAALCEPIFHVLTGIGSRGQLWKLVYVGVQNYFFNVYQLYQFKRNGFTAMYMCRIVYYLLWHVLWGYLRLEILF